ncbi:Uncharacterised protein [Mycobacteroides abscessus subsp. massiliense]|uniref:hypothetical protein n=1 Tax=Mycobacteroides TaxID=670516 RepID=UPI0003A71F1D|nr:MULTISPECIES: hypothetical protein [Mycobacteroides]MBN7314903.1 hypothetical protein [Mycobacteroides abscessus subsp. abscessus]MBN7483798.1 hypothetical protein [Mycobacteroides abscessus subsp. massiliense]MBV0918022.1 erythromycin esterase family protein [Mycobacteroides chelonae]RIT59399.1 hypothetical protein D2E95_09420 [Mycobacteroides abscessus]RIU52490.1 hypothetical protein D2F02_05605 [Mycobacteroides abscessus]
MTIIVTNELLRETLQANPFLTMDGLIDPSATAFAECRARLEAVTAERVQAVMNHLTDDYPATRLTDRDRAMAHRLHRWLAARHPDLGYVYEGPLTVAALLAGYQLNHEPAGWGSPARDTYIGIPGKLADRDRVLTLAHIPAGSVA